jgi:hypothetical protein
MTPREVLKNINSVLPEIKCIYKKKDNKWYVAPREPDAGFDNWVNFGELLVDLPIRDTFIWQDSLWTL